MDWKSLFRRTPDVVALSLHPDAAFVRCRAVAGGSALQLVAAARGPATAETLAAWKSQRHFRGAQIVLVLPSRLRSATPLPRPEVEDAELAGAMRWQIAASIDYPAEEALIDVLPLPALAQGQTPQVMVISARASAVREHMAPLLAAGLTPKAIDIEDLGQRNLGQRAAGTANAFATLGFTEREALLTIVAGGELCLTRSIGLGDAAHDPRGAGERLALQVQRTLDTFDRQVTQFAVKQLQLLPGPLQDSLPPLLAESLTQRVLALDPATLLRADLPETAAWREASHHRYALLLGVASARLPAAPAEAPATSSAAAGSAGSPAITPATAGAAMVPAAASPPTPIAPILPPTPAVTVAASAVASAAASAAASLSAAGSASVSAAGSASTNPGNVGDNAMTPGQAYVPGSAFDAALSALNALPLPSEPAAGQAPAVNNGGLLEYDTSPAAPAADAPSRLDEALHP